MESITDIIADFEKKINDLQRDNDGLKETLLTVSASVEELSRRVSMIEEGLATKVDITHIQEVIKQSEVIKKINDSEPVEMNCKVSVNLDGKAIAETTIEHTADSIHVTPNGVYTREDNRKNQF
ncbi:phage protein [Bacillus cereus HuB4-4]|uniref:Phage protein n=1 Tax=Bacillus cereus HuB4-4 TaxID=1053211 RepID=A0A9W5QZ11_BACCE|nr:hypothetical protein [Bacillus cereus]EOP96235.1 phage protein [Bacillus cereus HuB4-4]MDA2525249.1 hypothetical protein [Bacillus cereus]MDA2557902.1 hypothetical protein [Bacillus cereus]